MSAITNNNGYVSMKAFGGDNPLDQRVQSDHGEVAVVTTNGRVINVWNISNPAHHKYFAKDSGQTFTHTHMVPKAGSTWLEEKINDQIDTIAARMKKSAVAIQVVAEGYKTFYDQLAKALSYGKVFQFVSLLNTKSDELSSTKNVTGIIVDTSKYSLKDQDVMTVSYEDKENNRKSELNIPFVHVKDTEHGNELLVVAVHIPGTRSQYPKSGLEALAQSAKKLWEKKEKAMDMILLGDFNTAPENAEKHELGNLLVPSYFTHANPLPQASKYDLVAIQQAENTKATYTLAALSTLSPSTQALAASLEKAVRA